MNQEYGHRCEPAVLERDGARPSIYSFAIRILWDRHPHAKQVVNYMSPMPPTKSSPV